MSRIITISREFGSGGRTIGKKVAEKLGIPCYDAALIQKIAEESGYAADCIKEQGEYASGGWLSAVFTDRTIGLTNQDILWTVQSQVITEIAQKGPCVIVGRCADYILRDTVICMYCLIAKIFGDELWRRIAITALWFHIHIALCRMLSVDY